MSCSKIIHVPRRFVTHEWGGTETVIAQISRQQQMAGLEPHVFTSLALSTLGQETLAGIPVHRFPYTYPFFGLTAEQIKALDKKGGSMLSLSLLLALLREPDVQLFHAHAINRLGGMVRTAARLRHLPYVVSLHGGVFDVPQQERTDLQRPVEGRFEWGKPFGALLGSRRVLHDADYVICVGKSEATKAAGELKHDRIAYIPNGVNTAFFKTGNGDQFRSTHGIPKDAFLVLNISRIDAQKNQMLLLRAFAKLASTCPAAVLTLIGPETQPGYAAQLRQFIREQGLESRVRILPGLPPGSAELKDAYHACDVFVLPSSHEPFGIVVLEAWSSGKPVVASRVGGLQHLIADGETGLFVRPEAPDAEDQLCGFVHTLWREPQLRQRLARAGQEVARTEYSWEHIWDRTHQIYTKAVEHAAKRYANERKSMAILSNIKEVSLLAHYGKERL